jgi:hypothetical protein
MGCAFKVSVRTALERRTVIFASARQMNAHLPSTPNQRSVRRLDLLITNSEPPQEPTEFSLVLGGPLYRLFKRARLSGSALELLLRRLLVTSLLTWFPLVVLSTEGRLRGVSRDDVARHSQSDRVLVVTFAMST